MSSGPVFANAVSKSVSAEEFILAREEIIGEGKADMTPDELRSKAYLTVLRDLIKNRLCIVPDFRGAVFDSDPEGGVHIDASVKSNFLNDVALLPDVPTDQDELETLARGVFDFVQDKMMACRLDFQGFTINSPRSVGDVSPEKSSLKWDWEILSFCDPV